MSDQRATTENPPQTGRHGQDTVVFAMQPVTAGTSRDEFSGSGYHPKDLEKTPAFQRGNDQSATPLEGPVGGPFGPGKGKVHGGGGGGSEGGSGGGGGSWFRGFDHRIGGIQNALDRASHHTNATQPTLPTPPTQPTPSSGGNVFILFALLVGGGVAYYLWRKHHHKGDALEAVK